MTPHEYCEQKAAASGSSFYYSFMFLDALRRRAITALYAFCREVDDVVDECHDENVARTKLNWWRTEVTRVFQGAPEHPVGRALVEVLQDFDLPEEYFQEIIDGMEMDLDCNAYRSFKELSLYCYRAASVVGLMAAEVFGYQDRRTLKYAHDLGIAFQLTNILRDVREDAQRGRVYLPEEELDRFGVTRDDIVHGRDSNASRQLFAHQARRARQYYQRAFAHLPAQDRYAQRTGLIMAAVYQALLDTIEKRRYPVLAGRVRLSPLHKLWIAWRTAQKEKHRHLSQAPAGAP